MPKKCTTSNSSTPHKKQRLDKKSSKKNSRKTAESCRSVKQSPRYPTAKDQSPSSGCRPKSAPSSSISKESLAINCHPTFTDSVQFSCTCSSQVSKKTKALRRECSAGNPTIHCPGSYEKASQLDKNRSSAVRNEWETEIIIQRVWSWFSSCCGVPRKKENLKKGVKVQPGTGNKPRKYPKPCKAAKEPKPRKVFIKDKKICEADEEEKTFELESRDQIVRPCNCCKSRIKPDREKSRSCCSSLFCCSFINKLWKKKRKKYKNGTAAPCTRYLCLHNPGRSELDESIPCVKCTHNCNAKWFEKSGKESPAEDSTIIKLCQNSSSKTYANSKSTKTISEDSGPEKFDAIKIDAIRTEKICEIYKSDIYEQKTLAKIKKREAKCKSDNVRKSRKRKSSKNSKKPKRVNCDIPESSSLIMENKCCPCKVPETVVKLKTKPCMKCPNNTIVKKSSCKKLTFASCTDLRDYKLENSKKKRSVMGIVFDIIFWPYVFWPWRDPCK